MDVMIFKEKAMDLGLALDDDKLAKYEYYKDLLKRANETMNLTAIDDDEGIYEKHFYDSLLSIKYFKYEGTLCDVGSGAGFPGIVLKIAYPDLEVTLLEPLQKRCRFLQSVIDELKLDKIKVVNKRAEDYSDKRESFDIVTARAVKSLDILSELCIPLLKVDGHFVILKGSSGLKEIDEAANALKILHMKGEGIYEDQLPNGDQRVIAVYKKIEKTNKKYPRHYSVIKSKPLWER